MVNIYYERKICTKNVKQQCHTLDIKFVKVISRQAFNVPTNFYELDEKKTWQLRPDYSPLSEGKHEFRIQSICQSGLVFRKRVRLKSNQN